MRAPCEAEAGNGTGVKAGGSRRLLVVFSCLFGLSGLPVLLQSLPRGGRAFWPLLLRSAETLNDGMV